jgi:hypothetical protein
MLYQQSFRNSVMNRLFIESWLWRFPPVGFRLLHFLSFTDALRFLIEEFMAHCLWHVPKLESINCSQLLTESHFVRLVLEIICRNGTPKVGLAFQSCSYDVPSSRRHTRPSRKSASNKRRTACLSQGGVLLCETNCLHAYRL